MLPTALLYKVFNNVKVMIRFQVSLKFAQQHMMYLANRNTGLIPECQRFRQNFPMICEPLMYLV